MGGECVCLFVPLSMNCNLPRFNGKHCRWSRATRSPSKYSRDASTAAPGWDFGGASRNPGMQLSKLRDNFPEDRPSETLHRLGAKVCPTLSQYHTTHHPELTGGGEPVEAGRDVWLAAIGRLHRLVDDRAAFFQGDDVSTSVAAAHDTLGSRLRTHLRERWVVLALATNTWVRNGVAMNWMASLSRVGIDSYIIISLDLPTHESLAAIGAPTFFHETHYANAGVGVGASSSSRAYRASLLGYKWRVVSAILKRGVSTLLSDLDVVVLRDFRPLLDQSRSHIIAGRGSTKQLLIRMPFVLLRSCVEVIHLLPRLVAAVTRFRDDEYALNHLLGGSVAWAEPPLRQSTFDQFIEGKTFRSIGVGQDTMETSTMAPGAGGSLDPVLRLTLIPNRLVRLYECTKGHPAESALLIHCGNENATLKATELSLVMTRNGKLVEPRRPTSALLTSPDGSVEGGEFTKVRLTELGIWMLHPKWSQQYDLIQVAGRKTPNRMRQRSIRSPNQLLSSAPPPPKNGPFIHTAPSH